MIITCYALLLSSIIMCSAHLDCILSEWSEWGKCRSVCSKGKRTRTRYIVQNATSIFSKDCHPVMIEEIDCGLDNNGCEKFCEEATGKCFCPTGYTLGNDEKSCFDIDECAPNQGLGSCSQKCRNLRGGYICSCHTGFKLAPDGHDCIYNYSTICPSKMSKIDGGEECICKNGLKGDRCDRNETLCVNKYICLKNDLCLAFIHALHRCVSISYQVPILLRMTHKEYVTANVRYQVERYIGDILDGLSNGKTLDNLSGPRHKMRRSTSFYVEGSNATEVKSFTYANFAVLDVHDYFQELSIDRICPLLESSDIRCMNQADCNILQSTGVPCPLNLKTWMNQKGQKTEGNYSKIKSWVYILISGFSVIILLLVILLLLYLKRRKKSRRHLLSVNYDVNLDQPILSTTEFNLLPQNDAVLVWNGTTLNNNSYADKSASCKASNTFYNYDDFCNPDIPIYESIENIKASFGNNDIECDNQHFKAPSKTDGVMISRSSNENLADDKLSCSKMLVDLPVDDEEPRYITLPRQKKYSGFIL